jgi:hypothetical protein
MEALKTLTRRFGTLRISIAGGERFPDRDVIFIRTDRNGNVFNDRSRKEELQSLLDAIDGISIDSREIPLDIAELCQEICFQSGCDSVTWDRGRLKVLAGGSEAKGVTRTMARELIDLKRSCRHVPPFTYTHTAAQR